MKLIHTEMDAGLCFFQLPTLHPDIPLEPIISKSGGTLDDLAKLLVEADVINPGTIAATARTAHTVMTQGLGAWFSARTNDLKCLNIHFTLQDHHATAEMLQYLPDCDRVHSGQPSLVMWSTDEQQRVMEETARTLEAELPGLFKTAFLAIEAACRRTVGIRLPIEILHEISRSWSDGDFEVSTDEEAREALLERRGEDGEIERYLPSAVLPIYGGDLCASWEPIGPNGRSPIPKKCLPAKALQTYIKTHPGTLASKVAEQTLSLLKATRAATRADAKLPDLADLCAMPTERGCTLHYKIDEITWEILDDLANEAMQAGDGIDILGVQEVPASPAEIKKYFATLDTALHLLNEMDRLISLISTSYTFEDET